MNSRGRGFFNKSTVFLPRYISSASIGHICFCSINWYDIKIAYQIRFMYFRCSPWKLQVKMYSRTFPFPLTESILYVYNPDISIPCGPIKLASYFCNIYIRFQILISYRFRNVFFSEREKLKLPCSFSIHSRLIICLSGRKDDQANLFRSRSPNYRSSRVTVECSHRRSPGILIGDGKCVTLLLRGDSKRC